MYYNLQARGHHKNLLQVLYNTSVEVNQNRCLRWFYAPSIIQCHQCMLVSLPILRLVSFKGTCGGDVFWTTSVVHNSRLSWGGEGEELWREVRYSLRGWVQLTCLQSHTSNLMVEMDGVQELYRGWLDRIKTHFAMKSNTLLYLKPSVYGQHFMHPL